MVPIIGSFRQATIESNQISMSIMRELVDLNLFQQTIEF